LNARLHLPRWQNVPIDSLGETHVAVWATKTGATINKGFEAEQKEGGIEAVGSGFPAPSLKQLQVVPDAEWRADKQEYVWQELAKKILIAQGLPPVAPRPATENGAAHGQGYGDSTER
jgi:hypothetical protein